MKTTPATFLKRRSWALIGPHNKVIHMADNRQMLKLLFRKGDRIERCEIGPVTTAIEMPDDLPHHGECDCEWCDAHGLSPSNDQVEARRK